ncbi:MAG: hypothetical protein JST92_23565 [Deltaproteobacteria bacterium]|nr:hypothetical protein [Deltaproteobacteria bacterium]
MISLRIPAALALVCALALAACGGSDAALTCTAPMADCDGNADNGCETNLTTSHDHCGRCARSCLDGTCTNGVCSELTVSTETSASSGIAIDDAAIYTLQDSGATVRRVLKDGTSPTTLATVSAGPTDPGYRSIAVEGARVWWITPGAPLRMVPTAGGAVTDIADGATAVFSYGGGVTFIKSDGTIWAVPADQTTPTKLATSLKNPFDLTQGINGFFWANEGTLASSYTDGAIEVNANASVSDFAANEPRPQVIGQGTGFVVWSLADGRIRSKRIDDLNVAKDVTSSLFGVAGLEVDNYILYALGSPSASSTRGGPLFALDISITATTSTPTQQGANVGRAMVSDDKWLYAAGPTGVWKVAK